MAFARQGQKFMPPFRNNEDVIGGADSQFDGYLSLRKLERQASGKSLMRMKEKWNCVRPIMSREIDGFIIVAGLKHLPLIDWFSLCIAPTSCDSEDRTWQLVWCRNLMR
jgi:hypothetical protein